MSMSDPLTHLGSIWYHSNHLEISYSQTNFLVGTFFAVSYSDLALVSFELTNLALIGNCMFPMLKYLRKNNPLLIDFICGET